MPVKKARQMSTIFQLIRRKITQFIEMKTERDSTGRCDIGQMQIEIIG